MKNLQSLKEWTDYLNISDHHLQVEMERNTDEYLWTQIVLDGEWVTVKLEDVE